MMESPNSFFRPVIYFTRSVIVILSEMGDVIEGNKNVEVAREIDESDKKLQSEKPTLEMVFNGKNEFQTFYSNYAREEGFSVNVRSSNMGDYGKLKYISLAC